MASRYTRLSAWTAALVVLVAGCGANSKNSGSTSEATTAPATRTENTAPPAGSGQSGSSAGSAPADGPRAPEVKSGGTLYYLSRRADARFETASAQMVATSSIHWLHRGLTSWVTYPDRDADIVPDLTTDLGTTTDGGKTWTYHLKQGLKYSDGTEIVAEDVKYGIERSFAPIFQGGLGYHKTLLVGGADYTGPYDGKSLDSIEVKDKYTIVFHLTGPFGNWPWIVSMPAFSPVPRRADTDPETYATHPVASGPYMVAEFKQGSSVTLVRNPYWDKASDPARNAGPDKIVMSLGLNNDTIVQRLIADSGNDKYAISNATISLSQLQRIQADPSISSRMAVSPSGYLYYMALNTKRLTDVKVRQAIQYAVNKQEIQSIYGGAKYGGAISNSLITKGIPGYSDFNLYDGGPTGNPDKAKELLAAAGVSGLKLTLVYPTDIGDEEAKQAQSLKQSLARAGITVETKGMDSDSLNEVLDAGDYDLTINGWGADFPSGMSNLQPLFASSEIGNGGGNYSKYANPEVDKAMEAAIAEPDLDKAATMWTQIDRQIMQDAPMVPIITLFAGGLHGSGVSNYFIPGFPPFANEMVVGVAG